MYTLIFLAILVFLVNLPDYVKKHLTQKIAVESCEARDNFQLAQWNPITKREWLRLYPLKKVFRLSSTCSGVLIPLKITFTFL